jgi:8-oxo-dGTP pyrophosphatase MutT (NUDIX family)
MQGRASRTPLVQIRPTARYRPRTASPPAKDAGGRIELGETPEDCVVREIAEETGWKVTAGPILDSWMHHIAVADRDVFIVTYGCHPVAAAAPVLSDEHQAVDLFEEAGIVELAMPDGYKRSIADWFARAPDRGSTTSHT